MREATNIYIGDEQGSTNTYINMLFTESYRDDDISFPDKEYIPDKESQENSPKEEQDISPIFSSRTPRPNVLATHRTNSLEYYH
jgi:hypothetical protein